eukprot:CAMPEP_0202970732 /NCGR_PEP_ID=MMETSP1396-20130829/19352_1 /ASSEMBLY_ACC=CAM_ASM_000872 /TAXON_ID= /ORGANISM="Pseudokeronopsis sp., Strain Brazil" /LENGTH=95 /DNA_ID=CAMNT_0049699443 /DNA_START=95 /DNA_END=378 /DNA_ORIENTATION=+
MSYPEHMSSKQRCLLPTPHSSRTLAEETDKTSWRSYTEHSSQRELTLTKMLSSGHASSSNRDAPSSEKIICSPWSCWTNSTLRLKRKGELLRQLS